MTNPPLLHPTLGERKSRSTSPQGVKTNHFLGSYKNRKTASRGDQWGQTAPEEWISTIKKKTIQPKIIICH